jgi:fimbrial chaperone protein
VAITLTNDGDEEVVLQADVYQWTQNLEGLDKTEPTEDLIVSPPSLRLPPRSRQVVRLGLLIPRDRARQMTYRLVVREIPEAERRKDATLQVPIALVLNMPIFITPSGASRKIDCGWDKGEGAQPSLSCMNTGAAYAQVRSAEIRRGEQLLGKTDASAYILAGVRRSLPLQQADSSTMAPGRAQLTLVYDDLKTETKTIEIP